MGRSRPVVAMVAAVIAAMALAGCVQSAPTQKLAKSSVSSATPTPAQTTTADPTFSPDGTARANKRYFDFVNKKLLAMNGTPDGRTIIDTLVSAGFDRLMMQVTPDKTSINGGVDSILFSVKIGENCLLGQNGGGGYSSAVETALKNGACLVGKTRPIDW